MVNQLKLITCDRTCGFLIQGKDTKEIVHLFEMHALQSHQMKLAHNDIGRKVRKGKRLVR